jgi:anthranilate synthase/aminodeoxychorismate synthase-like glutamine amidotransferase
MPIFLILMKRNPKLNLLIIDNYDSFTYNLYDYFLQLKQSCQVIRNDELSLDQIQERSFDAIVLSPGPGVPEDAGILMPLIAEYYAKVPILGICLGHQAIGLHFGARLQKAMLPVHGKTSTLFHQGDPLFEDLPDQFEVMRYHSLILDELERTDLQIIAQTKEGENMAIRHSNYPLTGVQFHPESILTQFGLELLANWCKLTDQVLSIRNSDILS